MDMGTDALLDVIFGFAGVYLIYMGAKILIKRELANSTLLSKNVDLNNVSDPEGYIRVMGPSSIIAGIIFLLSSVINRLCAATPFFWTVNLVTMGVEVVAIIVFGIISHRSEKKYLIAK